MPTRRLGLLLAVPFLFLPVPSADAEPMSPAPPTNYSLVSAGGVVSLYFYGAAAAYNHLLHLAEAPAGPGYFPTHSTAAGERIDLGTFDAGTELSFRLHVIDTGEDYYTGRASLNPDALPHALAKTWSPSATIPAAGLLVAFEDMVGGGDMDYNDYQFVLSNVKRVDHAPVPEPSTLLIFGAAAGLAGLRRRVRREKIEPGC